MKRNIPSFLFYLLTYLYILSYSTKWSPNITDLLNTFQTASFVQVISPCLWDFHKTKVRGDGEEGVLSFKKESHPLNPFFLFLFPRRLLVAQNNNTKFINLYTLENKNLGNEYGCGLPKFNSQPILAFRTWTVA